MNDLSNKRIIVTGCGYKPINHVFYDITTNLASHDPITIDGEDMKMNIGTAIAKELSMNGATVHIVARDENKLQKIKHSLESITHNCIEFSAADLLDETSVNEFVKSLKRDKDIYWAQSVGLGAGSYKLKDDNPYLPLEQIDLGLIEAETNTVIRSTHIMMKELLPIIRKQKETRIAMITSMSAIRGYAFGGTHCAAKGAIDRYANSAMLALYKNNIFLTTIRPGAVDTGMYDNPAVQKAAISTSDEYNGLWRKQITLIPPSSVGQAVNYAFTTPAHITSMNLVAKGQFPNEGS